MRTEHPIHGGIVLCGGLSRRMGLPKASLPFGPETMLKRVVRQLQSVVGPVVVVAAEEQTVEDLPAGVRVVRDRAKDRGPLEGLAAGLSALGGKADLAYATGCDVPMLVPEFVRRMITLSDGHEIAVPVEGRFHHPLAAVYRTTVLPTIEQLLAHDRLRPVFLFDQVDTLQVDVETLREVDPRLQTLANLNQPEDYLSALRLAGFDVPPEILAAIDCDSPESR